MDVTTPGRAVVRSSPVTRSGLAVASNKKDDGPPAPLARFRSGRPNKVQEKRQVLSVSRPRPRSRVPAHRVRRAKGPHVSSPTSPGACHVGEGIGVGKTRQKRSSCVKGTDRCLQPGTATWPIQPPGLCKLGSKVPSWIGAGASTSLFSLGPSFPTKVRCES